MKYFMIYTIFFLIFKLFYVLHDDRIKFNNVFDVVINWVFVKNCNQYETLGKKQIRNLWKYSTWIGNKCFYEF